MTSDQLSEIEARVKELEATLAGHEQMVKGSIAILYKERARVAVLRDALQFLIDAHQTYPASGCAVAEAALATLDQAATALTERLKASEGVCEVAEYVLLAMEWEDDCDLGRALAAWRKVKGEP